MSADSTTELAQFQAFIRERLRQGQSLSPEEALDLWRSAHPQSETVESDLRAIRQALDELDAGERGVPLDEFEREFRRRHGINGDE